MADIFVSYKSEDRARARSVAEALVAEGLDVWWDPALQVGEDYQEIIDSNLRQSLVVVVLWSPLSVKSRWVRSEATIGDRYGALAPCMIEQCDLPTAFVLVQTIDLSHWRGDRKDSKWREFVDEVAAKCEKQRALRATKSPAAAPPDANAIESLFWQTIKDSIEPADFRSYIKRYPHGHFHDLAENRLKMMTGSRPPAYAPEGSPAKKPPVGVIAGALAGASLLAVGGYFVWSQTKDSQAAMITSTGPESNTSLSQINVQQFTGKWGPAGVGCDYPLVISISGKKMSFGASDAPVTIEGIEPDGAIRASSADGGTNFYAIQDGKLIVRSLGGDSITFTKCAS